MRISTVFVLLLIIVCTYARSFSDVDIPDPPEVKKHVKDTKYEKANKSLNSTTQQPITTKAPTQQPTITKVPTQQPTTTKASTQKPTTTKVPTQQPTTTVRPTTKLTTTKPTTTKPTTTKPTTTKAPTTTTTPTTTSTTTLDPWDEFCKEACEEGLAGPECDCPEHPIGRRSVGKRRHRRSTFIDKTETYDNKYFKHQYTSKAKPTVNLKVKRLLVKYCKEVCDHGIDNDICKCSGIDKGSNTTAAPGANAEGTTKDPLEEFCENACAEGEGTLACNCHDNIVGRRRRSVNTLTAYHAKDFLKTLDSNRLQHIQQRSDTTQLENTLPRVKLHKDSVQP